TVRPQILERFGRNASYFNTFGGNPVSAAVGLAVLQVIEDEGLQENARRVGAQLKEGLEGLAREHACLGQVRGAGLFIGVDVVDGQGIADGPTARRITNLLRDEGMLIGVSGAQNNALKIRPQLCFSAENVEQFLAALQRVLRQL
ncbi:MAG: aminotransferase class III-fold pyridoxal phosphate-dependent enzyme, partial [Pseudomonas sp.]